jgi:sugar phosphate isomerase/epimerase
MQEKQERLSRRRFVAQALKGAAVGAAAWNLPAGAADGTAPISPIEEKSGRRTEGARMKLGLVTYNLAKDWDVDTIIKRCEETGFEGVELRTTHAHKVESNLSGEERKAVRAKFETSKVVLVSLGTAFEYHSPDEATVRRNVDGTKEYLQLARDLGCRGVKVRPNGLPKEVPVEKTLRQIGESLWECGEAAEKLGVEIWLEVHGQGTSHLPDIRAILDVGKHPFVKICWNSNPSDVVDGSVKQNFELVREKVGSVHMRDLDDRNYPYVELFGLLKKSGFSGYCFAEISESTDPVRVMRYYKALWELMVSVA